MKEYFYSCMTILFWVGLFQDTDENLFSFVSVKPTSLADMHSFEKFFSSISHSTQLTRCKCKNHFCFIFPAKKHFELIYLHYFHWFHLPFSPDTAHSFKHFQFVLTNHILPVPAIILNKHLLIFNNNQIFMIKKNLCFPTHFRSQVCLRKLGI